MEKRQERHIGDHDWHSSEYVNDWIGRDIQRDDERRPLLQQMLERPGLASDAEIRILDVGAGYGVCLLYTSPSPRDLSISRMPSSA